MSAASKTFTPTLVREGSTCASDVPLDPDPVFGKARATRTRRIANAVIEVGKRELKAKRSAQPKAKPRRRSR